MDAAGEVTGTGRSRRANEPRAHVDPAELAFSTVLAVLLLGLAGYFSWSSGGRCASSGEPGDARGRPPLSRSQACAGCSVRR